MAPDDTTPADQDAEPRYEAYVELLAKGRRRLSLPVVVFPGAVRLTGAGH
jgi:hypothetical protein